MEWIKINPNLKEQYHLCPCSLNTLHRLMKLHNIHSIRKIAYKITTNSKHSYAVSRNLLQRNFTANKPNQKWVGDITYITTDEGWLYTAIVKNLCLKKIVGYAFSSRIDTNLTVSTLEIAVNRQKAQNNLIFHSDRGAQYASLGYRKALAKYNITLLYHGLKSVKSIIVIKFSALIIKLNLPVPKCEFLQYLYLQLIRKVKYGHWKTPRRLSPKTVQPTGFWSTSSFPHPIHQIQFYRYSS